MTNKFTRLHILQVEDKNGNIHTFTENTISFTVNKNIKGKANEGVITIKNLSWETRNILLKDMIPTDDKKATDDKRKCTLSVGYKGKPLNVILMGNIFSCCNTRSGVDIETEINVVDGMNLLKNGHLQMCFAKGTSQDDINDYYAKKAEEYEVLRGQIDAFNSVIPNAISLDNDFKNLKIDGYNVFIDNNKLNIIKKDTAKKGANTLLINNESGLLGIPVIFDGFIEVKMIMESSVELGQPARIEAETDKHLNGEYIIQGIKHNGTISFQGGNGECITTLELQRPKPKEQ
jgi:hypothetical protein